MTQHGLNDEADRRSAGCWTPPSALPEATEDDRLLVRATQAAIDAASHEFDSNSNDCAHANAFNEAGNRRPPRSIKGRFRSFLRSMLNGGSDGGQGRLNESNSAATDPKRHKKSGGACTRRRRTYLENGEPAPLENVSNKEPPPPAPPAADPQPQHTEKNEDTEGNLDEPQEQQEDAALPPSSDASLEQSTGGTGYPPIEKPRIFRGGPTTKGHKLMQDALFTECRVIPVATLYKKVAMVPGRGRLFLSAPSNPRPLGSPMLYDIAYENRRHHSDCNRDFARTGLKKICSNYCKPSQFRYVY